MKKHMQIIPTSPDSRDQSRPFTVIDENGRKWGQYEDEDKAQIRCNYVNWLHDLPVGQRSSSLLIHARSVCSKAWTSYTSEERYGGPFDAEELDIICDLKEVVEILEKYERTKPTPKPPWAHKDSDGHWPYFGDY